VGDKNEAVRRVAQSLLGHFTADPECIDSLIDLVTLVALADGTIDDEPRSTASSVK
jgi:hypothetical protein